jgi:hypothetical protein
LYHIDPDANAHANRHTNADRDIYANAHADRHTNVNTDQHTD